MGDAARGEIYNRERAKQLHDFRGLCYGKITPTDIDMYVEFRDKLYVWGEAKLVGEALPDGQRRALERNANLARLARRTGVAFVLEHNNPPEQDIDFATCPVLEYWYKGKWQEPLRPLTCKEAIDILLDSVNLKL